MEERVTIEVGSLQLEGMFTAPDQGPVAGGMVICHPHPQYGGDMSNNVVMALQTAALGADYATLRFNFRGVGASQGSYEGGISEREDAKAALSLLRDRLGSEMGETIVAGYSFGAYVGSAVAVEDGSVDACILVSPPVEMMDFEPLKTAPLRVLFIAGDSDPYCPIASLESFRKDMTGENSLLVVPGADHFYFGMDSYITRFAGRFLKPDSPSDS